MIAAIAVTDNSAYSAPTWAIIVACVWAAIVIGLHAYAFVKSRQNQQRELRRGSSHPHTTVHA